MNKFESMMLELKQEYISEIPMKLEEIRSHLNANDIVTLQDDFHKLKGTGKTYGIPEISALGEVTETICRENPDQAMEAILKALDILDRIHQNRADSKAYPINSDDCFVHLKNIAANSLAQSA